MLIYKYLHLLQAVIMQYGNHSLDIFNHKIQQLNRKQMLIYE